jgi:hypothetical protein
MHLYLVPRLRTNGVLTPLSHMPSYHAQGEINFTFAVHDCGEGPRSRSYGRTAALRFIVQPL